MRSFLLLILFALSTTMVFSQEQLKHTKKTYASPDGKLYINKDLPVYVWLSNSPDVNSQKYRLMSEDSKKYTNPLYFDTEGYNTVRTPSKVDTVTKKAIYPIEDIIFEVYADGLAPKVKISIDSTSLFRNGDKLYCSGSSIINVIVQDEMSGVEKSFLSVNGAPFSEFTKGISLSDEQEYTLKAYAVDNCGNASETVQRTFYIDKSAPVTKLVVDKDQSENNVSARSVIHLKSEDKYSGTKTTKYSIDGGKEVVYQGGIYCTYLKEGEHTVSYYSQDVVGNKENLQTYKFFVDKTAPVLIDEIQGDTYIINGKEFTSGRSKIKLTAMDNKSGVGQIFYTTNGVDYLTYSEPFYMPNTKGNQMVSFYAVDKVNNSNKGANNTTSSRQRVSYMDLSGPQLSHVYLGLVFKNRDTVFINTKTKIKLVATDLEAGVSKITYAINGKGEEQYKEPFEIDKEGTYTIHFTGFDNVMNSNQSNFYFIVDTKGPKIDYKFSIEPIDNKLGHNVYPAHTVVFLTATDDECGFDKFLYSINGGEMRLYTGFIQGLAKNKEYTIRCKAYDKLGNFTEDKFEFHTGD